MNSFRFVAGLGETYVNQARSAIEQDFNGKAVDCVLEAITVLAQYVNVCSFVFLLFMCSAKYVKYAERAVPLTRVMGLSWINFVPCFDSFCQRNFGLPKNLLMSH